MSTTTIRLPPDLKERVARAAKRAGTTAHSFILEAIAEKAEQEERRSELQDTAEQRYGKIVAAGKTVPWSEMRRNVERQVISARELPSAAEAKKGDKYISADRVVGKLERRLAKAKKRGV